MNFSQIIKTINVHFRHNFPYPELPDNVYVRYEVKCDKCLYLLSLLKTPREYIVHVNETELMPNGGRCLDDSRFGDVLCKKVSTFL